MEKAAKEIKVTFTLRYAGYAPSLTGKLISIIYKAVEHMNKTLLRLYDYYPEIVNFEVIHTGYEEI